MLVHSCAVNNHENTSKVTVKEKKRNVGKRTGNVGKIIRQLIIKAPMIKP